MSFKEIEKAKEAEKLLIDLTEGKQPEDANGEGELSSNNEENTHETSNNSDTVNDSVREDSDVVKKTEEDRQNSTGDYEDQSAESFEQKYKVLQGKYDAETKRYLNQIKSLTDQLNDAEVKIEQFSRQLSEPRGNEFDYGETNKRVERDSDIVDINPEDFQGFGYEVMSLAKYAKNLAGYTKQLESKIEGIESDITRKDEAVKTNSFNEELDKLCPNWKYQDVDPNFLSWLKERPTKQKLINIAAESGDARSIADIFNEYRSTSSTSYIFAQEGESNSAPAAKKQVSENVQSQIQPAKNNNGTPPPQAKAWTEAEIKQEFDRLSRDLSAGRITPVEFEKKKNEIINSVFRANAS